MGKKKVEVIHLTVEGPGEPLRITYDRAARAAYIQVREGKVADTLELEEGVVVDLDSDGFLLGIELLKQGTATVLDQIAKRYKAPQVRAVNRVAEMVGNASQPS
jgi:uncharacterized protein YuzE